YIVQWQRAWGTAAEYSVVPARLAATLPNNTTFAQGACLGIPAVTAHRCLFADGPISGLTVLVTGGAGAVGHYAVQLAKWAGATVIATVSSADKAASATTAGADHTVNYKTGDAATEILQLTGGAGVDRIVDVDFGGNLTVSARVIKTNRSEEHTSELQSRFDLVCRLLLEKKNQPLNRNGSRPLLHSPNPRRRLHCAQQSPPLRTAAPCPPRSLSSSSARLPTRDSALLLRP